MIILIISILFLNLGYVNAQYTDICLTKQTTPELRKATRTINDLKTVRINYHFMLLSNGTGNFTETTNGNGSSSYNGYLYANDITNWMNNSCSWNEQMNIPTGNTTPVISKKFNFVTDAIYFWRDNQTYNFQTINYITQGRNKDSVLNIFLSFDTRTDINPSGYATQMSSTSKTKYTENRAYWQAYIQNVINAGLPFSWHIHSVSANTIHEIGHLFGLSHTVRWNNAPPCPTGCIDSSNKGFGTIDILCDDGCNDTPTAWSITTSGGCSNHPACGWNTGSIPNCSNNVMDYNGANALTPCQINIIHSSLEGGMRTYLSCAAVSVDLSVCDIGYPKVSYFGKVVSIGCTSTLANITNNENIQLYFSESVELNNFEVNSNSQFEVIEETTCTF